MKTKITTLVIAILFATNIYAQTGVSISENTSTPHGSAMLDIQSDNKGLLIPRVTLIDIFSSSVPVNNPAIGLLVYNENSVNNIPVGFYSWAGTQWNKMMTLGDLQDNSSINELQTISLNTSTNIMTLSNNGGTADLSPYLDNTDNQQLAFNQSNNQLSISNGNTVNLSSDYAFIKCSTDQTPLVEGEAIKFNYVIEGNLTTNSNGQITLNAGKNISYKQELEWMSHSILRQIINSTT